MGRKPDAIRRAELLSGFVDYIIENGLAELSLRPVAAALGTSPQVLLYHFHSKEELLTEAIAQVRSRHEEEFTRSLQRLRKRRSPASQTLRSVWRWYTAERHMPYFRLFHEVYGLAIRYPERYQQFREMAGRDHRSYLEAGLVVGGLPPGPRTRAIATFYYAAFRGLVLDLLTTGDRARVNAAVGELEQNLRRTLSEVPRAKPAKARSPGRLRRASPRREAR